MSEKNWLRDRKMWKVKCADCGIDCEVPFEPDGEREVYCKNCLRIHRPSNRFYPEK